MRLIIQLFGKLIESASRDFYQALENPESAQQKVRKEILKNLIKSDYGRYLRVKTIEDWHRIPIVEYHNIENWIHTQQQDKTYLLTSEKIVFYEKTSGSRGAAKFIPYTNSLRRSFNQMFCIWTHDLIKYGPKFTTGKLYFCISPQLAENKPFPKPSACKSLKDDSEYLDGWLKWVMSQFLVFPSGLNKISDAEKFKHQLAQSLLISENLEIISIWSPTFLKVILDYIQNNRKQLALELATKMSAKRRLMLLQPHLFQQVSINQKLSQINRDKIAWNLLWSELKLISCWDSANAADGADFLRSLFPNVLVQGKGLLATEAPMTIPLIPAKGCVPLLNEVFFEFLDESGFIYQLHELKQGKIYEIIISQKGGLYRYRIGDRVCFTHSYLNTPCLEFVGRQKEVSDLVGEKLHSEFVREILETLPLEGTCFKSLVPVKYPKEHYILLIDTAKINPAKIALQLEESLQKSSDYHRARLLEQLQPVQVLVSAKIPQIISLYKTNSGKKWGDLQQDILATQPIEKELLIELEQACLVNN
ncbi:GH3 auxin-responsive promoter family protein [Plectonema cf. radiosum LEGE 06105]|uniref:GH3 auxin-responsive promoter family protein n=1 Tax=Plectonema cf. radiosum LEGE 06105 TaxID=945769 RepID=A0A8J7EX23_9CYAN|nr:GH3 auxin-responsive promoter family protein [Plectonema radiosum]MBE9211333.1 GH3 auxin-responsive promoter family protein [Plectonema cf. radiosum LEGE 06105]